MASKSRTLTLTRAPLARFRADSSESDRKRLHASSMATSSSRRIVAAVSTTAGSVTATSAVVPMARIDRIAGCSERGG
jgi:hypothetical protein